jgi:hypothetical protein
MRNQSRRETTPDEAMAALRGERDRPAVVRANTGAESVDLARSRYGHIQADIYVEPLAERRTLSVTETQARDIVVRAGTRDTDGVTLELLPFDETVFADPRSETDA